MYGKHLGKSNWPKLIAVLFCAVTLFGCVKPGTRIASNVAPDYRRSPSRLFVITSLGPEIGSKKLTQFKSTFTAAAQECGAEVEFYERQPLALDDSAQNAAVKSFNPDALLTMAQLSHTTLTSGYITEVTNIDYGLQLADLQLKKIVWKAKISFAPRADMFIKDNGGELLGKNLAEKLKEDGVLRNCTAGSAT